MIEETDLFGNVKKVPITIYSSLQEKIDYAIRMLKKAERIALMLDPENGFYLAFSGGKDSQALYHIAKEAGVKFKAHFSPTTVDPPEVIRFIRQNYPDVEFVKPKKNIYDLAVEKQILPSMRVRWCCAEFKEVHGGGKVTLTGVRKSESARRAKRNEVELDNHKYSSSFDQWEQRVANADQVTACMGGGKEKLIIMPIFYWTEADVWQYLKDRDIPHCSLYDEGWKRIGCIGCPMSSPKTKARENERWPHVKEKWIKAIMKIRSGGGIQKRIYLVEHPEDNAATQISRGKTSLGGGWIAAPSKSHWLGETTDSGRVFRQLLF